MTDTVYKIAYERFSGRYFSIAIWFNKHVYFEDDTELFLEYKIGEVTKPKIENSAIYAFDTIANVKRFMDYMSFRLDNRFAVFECEYAESDAPALVDYSIEYNNIIKLWQKVNDLVCVGSRNIVNMSLVYAINRDTGVSIGSAPKGTVMCEWVKPIKIVQVKETDYGR